MKYENEFRKHFSGEPVFTSGDALRFLSGLGSSKGYAKLFLHNQMRRKGLLRIGRGRYTFLEDEEAVGFAFRPFYYGLEYALTIHRFWTQMANPVVVTMTKAIPGIRSSGGHQITVRRISKGMFFGIEHVKSGKLFVPVSDAEKTLIDFLYYKEPLQDEASLKLLDALDRKKLDVYLKRCPMPFRNSINAFIAARLK